jgi:hypothetical protein
MATIGSATIDLNALGDTTISLTNPGSGNYVATGYAWSGASSDPSSAVAGGVFSAPNGGGDKLFAIQGAALHAVLVNSGEANAAPFSNVQPEQPAAGEKLYAHITTANGATCTVILDIFGESIA